MIYTEDERAVYTCAVTGRRYDPLAVKRAIVVASKGRFNDLLEQCRSPDAVKAAEAETAVIDVGRRALGLAPIDAKTGEGVLDSRVHEALTLFTRWLSGKGGRAQNSPTSAPCTDCPGGN